VTTMTIIVVDAVMLFACRLAGLAGIGRFSFYSMRRLSAALRVKGDGDSKARPYKGETICSERFP